MPGAQCLGEHVFEYPLELGEPDNAELVRRSQDYRFDFAEGPPGAQLDGPLSIVGRAAFSALKAAEDGDGVILRVFNPGFDPAKIALTQPVGRCRLDESPLPGKESSAVTVSPGEIATIRVGRAAESASPSALLGEERAHHPPAATSSSGARREATAGA